MTAPLEPTSRQLSEREFHDRWAETIDIETLKVREAFEAVTAVENRFALESLGPLAGLDVLDLGCGAGETSAYLALQGARVKALDVSARMVEVAALLAERHGARVEAVVGAAECLPFPDASFDRVFANGVLHHVELLAALSEVRRVLRPGGKAAFVEPLKHNPAIWVYHRLAAGNRTPHERPLGFGDFARVRSVFPRTGHREFWLFALLLFARFFFIERADPSKVRYWKKVIEEADRYAPLFRRLKRLDDLVLGALPALGRFCWNTVITVEKER